MKILLVEDNTALATALLKALADAKFDVAHVLTGHKAIESVKRHTPDALVLDLGLPDMDGLAVLKQCKKWVPQMPVLILTARDTLDDKVTGLTAGADDYLAKPFEMPELLARLSVIERRIMNHVEDQLSIGNVTLDLKAREVFVDSTLIELSRREFDLLRLLMANADKVVTRSSLEAQLYSWDEDVNSNALEVHIHSLRKKLGKSLITTLRGIGYTLKKS